MLKAKNWKGEPVKWVTRKHDGHRVFIDKSKHGIVTVDTERKDVTSQIRHNAWFGHLQTRVPLYTRIEGELICDGHATDVSSRLANHDLLDLIVFAVPYYRGNVIEDAPLYVIHDLCTLWNLTFTEYHPFHKDNTPKQLLAACRKAKWEGVVLKQANYQRWYKLKVENTVECFVTGFVDGKGKYLGLIGSLRVSLYGGGNVVHEVATVGGFTDEVRIDIDETDDLYRVCEVRFQNVGANGRLRHPRFVRWRDDRRAEHCFIGQIDTSRCKAPIK